MHEGQKHAVATPTRDVTPYQIAEAFMHWTRRGFRNNTFGDVRDALCGPDADPSFMLGRTVNIAGTDFHVEAVRVRYTRGIQEPDTRGADYRSGYEDAAERWLSLDSDGPPMHTELAGVPYVVVIHPHSQ